MVQLQQVTNRVLLYSNHFYLLLSQLSRLKTIRGPGLFKKEAYLCFKKFFIGTKELLAFSFQWIFIFYLIHVKINLGSHFKRTS